MQVGLRDGKIDTVNSGEFGAQKDNQLVRYTEWLKSCPHVICRKDDPSPVRDILFSIKISFQPEVRHRIM
jgi:hypothetical protein